MMAGGLWLLPFGRAPMKNGPDTARYPGHCYFPNQTTDNYFGPAAVIVAPATSSNCLKFSLNMPTSFAACAS